MAIQILLIELSFDQETITLENFEAIRQSVSGVIHTLNDRGVFSSLCEPPTLVNVVSVQALTAQQKGTVQLALPNF